MKAFLTACATTAVITVAAWGILTTWNPTAIDSDGGENVRLADQ